MIQHLLFDFGGVILDLDGVHNGYPNDLAEIFSLPITEAKRIWDENKTAVMIGQESPKSFLMRMKQELDLSFDIDSGLQFWQNRNTITRDRIDWSLLEKIQDWKKQYSIHLLTDQIPLDNGAQDWIDEVNRHFDSLLRSYEQGFRKPDKQAFVNALEKIGAQRSPETVLFIDDNPANVSGAESVGINGLCYSFGDHQKLSDFLSTH